MLALVNGPYSSVGTSDAAWKFSVRPSRSRGDAMKDFSNATFVPEIVSAMTEALDASVATLPHPVNSTQVNLLAESILRTAQAGERDPVILQRMALLELQITPRE
jgi:hypothetical protein